MKDFFMIWHNNFGNYKELLSMINICLQKNGSWLHFYDPTIIVQVTYIQKVHVKKMYKKLQTLCIDYSGEKTNLQMGGEWNWLYMIFKHSPLSMFYNKDKSLDQMVQVWQPSENEMQNCNIYRFHFRDFLFLGPKVSKSHKTKPSFIYRSSIRVTKFIIHIFEAKRKLDYGK